MRLVFIFAALVLVLVVTLYRVYHLLPLRELKRRARGYHDPQAAAIYKVAANPEALDIPLYILGLAAVVFMATSSARYSWWAACLSILFIAWLIFLAPRPAYGGLLWRFCAASSKYIFKFLSWLRPGTDLVARALPTRHHGGHAAYELEDLLELLEAQATQSDNRIPKRDLLIAAAALSFADKQVGKVMTARKKLRFVSEDEVLGPMLIDELHRSGRYSFPVVRGSAKVNSPDITGVLFLADIVQISQENKGKVKDLTRRGTYYINEACNLDQALDAVLKKQHHQLLVINNFEELVGIITFEDLLKELIGERLTSEFENYDNIHAVASLPAAAKTETKDRKSPEKPPAPVLSADKTTIATGPE